MPALYKIGKPQKVLLLLLSFHFIGNLIWLSLSNLPPNWDASAHSSRAISFSNFFHSVFSGNPDYDIFIKTFSDAYPPLITLLMGVIMFIFGSSVKLAQLTGTLFFIPLLYLLYLLGKEVSKNEWIGVIGVFFFSFFHIIYDNSRWFLLDIPLTFFITLTLLLLYKSNYLSDKKYAFLAGASVFLVALTKIQGVFYLLLPFFVFFAIALSKKHYKGIPNAIYGLFISGVIAIPYLFLAFDNLKRYFVYALKGEPLSDPTNLASLTTWVFYLKLFINNCVPLILFIPLVVALIFKKVKFNTELLILSGNALFTYICFTIFTNKDLRFIFPILTLIAIIFSYGLVNLYKTKKRLAQITSIYLLLVSIFLYINLSFGFPFKKGNTSFIVLPFFNDITVVGLSDYPVAGYNNEKWPYVEIIKDIGKYRDGDEAINLVFIPNYDHFNDNSFFLYNNIYGKKKLNIVRFGGRSEFKDKSEIATSLGNLSLFLYTDGDPSVFYSPDQKAAVQMQSYVRDLLAKGKFKIINKYLLPSGQKIYLLERLFEEPICNIDYSQKNNHIEFTVSWSNNETEESFPFDFGDGSLPFYLSGNIGATSITHDYPYNEIDASQYIAGFRVVSGSKAVFCKQKIEIMIK